MMAAPEPVTTQPSYEGMKELKAWPAMRMRVGTWGAGSTTLHYKVRRVGSTGGPARGTEFPLIEVLKSLGVSAGASGGGGSARPTGARTRRR